MLDALFILSRILNGFRVALNPVFPPFNKLERLLLDEIESHVIDKYRTCFKDHIESVNFVQRDGYRRVRMYKWVFPGTYSWNRIALFPHENSSKKLVKFKIHTENNISFGGSLKTIEGVIFDITFGRDISFISDFSTLKIEVLDGPICKVVKNTSNEKEMGSSLDKMVRPLRED